jgi:predicted SAM-dependent methyltransferase
MNAKILDLGCGNKKRPGAVGVDHNPETAADVVHSLDSIPYPFETSSFDEIYADNVVEHLNDVIKTMEELHRISRPGGAVTVIVPYFRSQWAFIDPTHKHFFTVDSFSYFDGDHIHSKLYNYTKARFAIEKVAFNEGVERGLFARGVVALANRWPGRYERYLSHLFPLDCLTFVLRTLK